MSPSDAQIAESLRRLPGFPRRRRFLLEGLATKLFDKSQLHSI